MSGRFVIHEEHFHISDNSRYVLIGWFDSGADDDLCRDLNDRKLGSRESDVRESDKDLNEKESGIRKSDSESSEKKSGISEIYKNLNDEESGVRERENGLFEAYLDRRRLGIRVTCIEDDSVPGKYAKYDLKVSKEYVIQIKLPKDLTRFHRLIVKLSDGRQIYERSAAQLRKMQPQMSYHITNIQSTGASCVLSGWAASKKPIKIRVLDNTKVPVKCEISHFPKPDIALEFRETDQLYDSGFSVTVPINGRKKMILQLSDGERSATRVFRAVDKNRVMFYLKKAHYYMKRNGMKKACKRAVNELYELVGDTGNYSRWRKKNVPTERELARQKLESKDARRAGVYPLFYVITPYQDLHHFTGAASSLKNQTYGNWRWVIACTQTEKDKLIERLHGYLSFKRIVFLQVDAQESEQQKIARAVDWTAQRGQKNTWAAFLGASDTLEPDALYSCMRLFEQDPDMDLCYTDEDRLSEDGKLYTDPVFKSDFNIDMLRAMNYFGHMVLIRTDLMKKVGAWSPSFGTNASYDYNLRAAEAAASIGHLPRVVYHSRELGKQVHQPCENILNAHYKRQGIPAEASSSQVPGIYHTTYQWEETPLVSINIPNKDHMDDLDTCVQSVLKMCTYPNYEIVIIENNSTEDSTFAYYKKLQEQDQRVRVVYWKEEFNYAKIANFGAAQSKGSYLLLMNNDTEVMTPEFMEEMLGYCMREDVGICGARLFYFDDTIQHAGVIVGLGGICGEGFQGFPKENGGYQNRIFCPQDYSAVTAACMMTKKSVFEEVGGMDENLQIAYNDIDYCLKVRETGRLVVYNPFAMLHHYEYKSRGIENTAEKLARYHKEVDLFTTRWADLINVGDPYYNPNLTKRYQDFSLRRIELLQ